MLAVLARAKGLGENSHSETLPCGHVWTCPRRGLGTCRVLSSWELKSTRWELGPWQMLRAYREGPVPRPTPCTCHYLPLLWITTFSPTRARGEGFFCEGGIVQF